MQTTASNMMSELKKYHHALRQAKKSGTTDSMIPVLGNLRQYHQYQAIPANKADISMAPKMAVDRVLI
jgi:hypothetical protein